MLCRSAPVRDAGGRRGEVGRTFRHCRSRSLHQASGTARGVDPPSSTPRKSSSAEISMSGFEEPQSSSGWGSYLLIKRRDAIGVIDAPHRAVSEHSLSLWRVSPRLWGGDVNASPPR